MLDLFSCKRKSGDGLVRYFAVPDSVGRGSARYIGGVFDLGSRNWAGRSTPFPCLVRMHR